MLLYYTNYTGLYTYSKSLLFVEFHGFHPAKPKDLRAFQAVSSSLKQLPQSLEEDIGAPDADASTASSSTLVVEDVNSQKMLMFFSFCMNCSKFFFVISWEPNTQNGSIKRSYPLVNLQFALEDVPMYHVIRLDDLPLKVVFFPWILVC